MHPSTSPRRDGPKRQRAGTSRRLGGAVQAVLIAALVLNLVHAATGFGGAGTDALFTEWVHSALMISAALVCVCRAAVSARDRAAWASFAVALATYAAGEIAGASSTRTSSRRRFRRGRTCSG